MLYQTLCITSPLGIKSLHPLFVLSICPDFNLCCSFFICLSLLWHLVCLLLLLLFLVVPPPAVPLFIPALMSLNLPPSPWFPPLSWKHEHTSRSGITCVREDASYYLQFFHYFPFLKIIHYLSLSLFLFSISISPSPLTIWTPRSSLSLSLCLPADSSLSELRPIWGRLRSGEKTWCHPFQRRRAGPAQSHAVVYMKPSLLKTSVTRSCRHSVCHLGCSGSSLNLIHSKLQWTKTVLKQDCVG